MSRKNVPLIHFLPSPKVPRFSRPAGSPDKSTQGSFSLSGFVPASSGRSCCSHHKMAAVNGNLLDLNDVYMVGHGVYRKAGGSAR